MRVALYGGTFDPVHLGHVEVARAAADTFGLGRVMFVPAGNPPHRAARPRASYEDRYRMVELACLLDGRFRASRAEAPRPGNEPNYSIDTLEEVTRSLGSGDRLYFVIGCDAFAEIESWHRWEEMLKLADFIVVSRPGEATRPAEPPPAARMHLLTSVDVPISSTRVRDRLRSGQPADQWLPPAVAEYVGERKLYQG